MSSALVWDVVRKQNCFLVKRNGAQLSSAPGNLTGEHSYKWSTLAASKAVGVERVEATKNGDDEKKTVNTVYVTRKQLKKANKPKGQKLAIIAKSRKQTLEAIQKLSIEADFYRPDQRRAAISRALRMRAAVGAQKRGVVEPSKFGRVSNKVRVAVEEA